jgi:hypothetical protein
MAKLVTANTGEKTLTLSTSVYAALSNAVVFHFGAVSNTNLEKLACLYLANGLRASADFHMTSGEVTAAGLSVSYLEGNLKANSE